MDKVVMKEVQNLIEYGKVREDYRRKIIQLKTPRRIDVGSRLSFLFENRETVMFQVQEMIWAERIVDEKEIQKLIDIYNMLLPSENELSATVYIQFENDEELRSQLKDFVGVASNIHFQIGDSVAVGIPEEGRETADQVSTVQYVRFKFSPKDVELFKSNETPIYLAVNHPKYQARVELPRETRLSLAEDFS